MACTETGPKQFSRRIQLIGPTGNGKSSLGNVLLSRSPRLGIDFTVSVGVGRSSMRRVLNEDRTPDMTTIIESVESIISRQSSWSGIDSTGSVGVGERSMRRGLSPRLDNASTWSAIVDTNSMIYWTIFKHVYSLSSDCSYIRMISEDVYSVIQKSRKQTQKSRKSQLIDFCSPFHEMQEMVLYNTKMIVTESRTIASGCIDPCQDIYRTSAYLLILFGLTAFGEKQALEQVMESMWKHIFWNESLTTYSLSDKNEKETKDVEESITASGKELLKNEAPVEVSVNIDNVSMEEQPTAGSYDKQTAEDFLALEQMLMCKVCLDADLCIVFLPCRHMATCESCASVMQSCPVCRSVIQDSVKLNYDD